MLKEDTQKFDAPIPGMALAGELGAEPWQNPAQHPTVEGTLDYYMTRMATDEFEDNLWEIAVLDSEGTITYHTPVTQDVIGRQTDEDVERVLKEISELGSEYETQLELKFGENND